MSVSAEAKATTDAANHVVRIAKCLRDNKFTELQIEKKPGKDYILVLLKDAKDSVYPIRVKKVAGKQIHDQPLGTTDALDSVMKCAEEHLDDIRSCEGYHRVMIGASKE